MKTPSEITARIGELEKQDPYGFERQDLMQWLPYEYARDYLREGITEEQWDGFRPDKEDSDVRKAMLDYLPFAWSKMCGERGLSTQRSMHHFRAWLWLLGKDGLADRMFPYKAYGREQLIWISNLLKFDWKKEEREWYGK